MSLAGNGRRTPPEHAPGVSGVPNLTVVADREPAASAFAAGGPAVRLTDVTKVYGQGTRAVLALDKVSLSVAPGEFTCIIGASGCGKSTLLNLVAGLDQITSGQLDTGGQKVTLMFQEPALFPWLTASKNVELALRARGVPKAERRPRALELLEAVHLGGFAGKRPHELSGGMRQRVALARALANDPQILLFDEPLAALDAQTRRVMQDELLRIWRETGKTFVYVTHSLSEAVLLGTRIVLMTAGPGRVKRIEDVTLPRPRLTTGRAEAAMLERLDALLGEEVARAMAS